MKKLFFPSVTTILAAAGLMGSVSALNAQTTWLWEQLPNLSTNGIDVLDISKGQYTTPGNPTKLVNRLAGDDFKPLVSGPLTSIHLYGSWLTSLGAPALTDPGVKFHISIHLDNPAIGTGFSTPGKELWGGFFLPTSYSVVGTASQGFFDTKTGTMIGRATTQYEYDFLNLQNALAMDPLSPTTLNLDQNTTYWILVQAQSPMGNLFGWTSSLNHYGDAAVFGDNSSFGNTRSVFLPIYQTPGNSSQPIDLAFSLDTPEPSSMAIVGLGLAAMFLRRRKAA